VNRYGAVPGSFTNGDTLKAPGSPWLGVQTYRAIKYKWERMSSWWCDGSTFQRLDRQTVRKLVLNGSPAYPWIGYCTTSYKKHGALFVRVNHRSHGWWRFEMLDVDCSDPSHVVEWWGMLRKFQDIGLSRAWLEKSDGYVDKDTSIEARIRADKWCREKRFDPLYRFLCYLLPSKEELEAIRAAKTPKVTNRDWYDATGQMSLL
jgi:hypothetical protein